MTIASALNDLYGFFCDDTLTGRPVTDLTTIVKVFRGVPAAGAAPTPTSLSIVTGPTTAIDYSFTIRIYQAPLPDILAAQDVLVAAIDEVSALLASDDRFGRTDWSAPTWDAAIEAFYADTTFDVGRTDF